ncbi:hypothetical protein JCM8202v2_001818 [Rhodotorula sphaerocarpa]
MATSCVDGYTLTSGGHSNCGSIGNVCSVEGAKSQFCLNGKCLASSCESGLSLTASGKCLNLQSDPSNW